jgi:hypothetical protein
MLDNVLIENAFATMVIMVNFVKILKNEIAKKIALITIKEYATIRDVCVDQVYIN